jgi:eukaryotic-like serine/threonine-protein kinase
LIEEFEGRFPEDRAAVAAAFDRAGRPEMAGPSTRREGVARPGSADLISEDDQTASRPLSPGTTVTDAGTGAAPSIPAGLPSIPGFEIQGELGRGGMGVVYLARQVRLKRPCALKMIRAGRLADARDTDRFFAEAEAAAKLSDPNIVQVYSLGEWEGMPYLELEYVEGGSLADRLDGTPRPPLEAARLVETLARSIAAAHARGIVHRDLKPANVLVTTDGHPKITDFGLAKAMDVDSGLTGSGEVLGTPSYMAPEQAEGRAKQAGPPVDVYALGAVLYELLTGRPPFRGASLMETLEQVRGTEPVPPSRLVPHLPRDLETICLKCLNKEPSGRYASATDLAEDLGRFAEGRPIHARPIGLVRRLWRWSRRHPEIAGLTAAMAAVLFASTVGAAIAAYQFRLSAARERALAGRSEENFRRARQVVEEMYTQVAASLDVQRGMDEYQRDILQKALSFYVQSALPQSQEPAVRHEAGWAGVRAGDIEAKLGRPQEAEAAYARALAVLEPLVKEHPEVSAFRQTLAIALNAKGINDFATHRSEEAKAAHERARDLRQQLRAEKPRDADALRDLAASHHNLGDIHLAAHHGADAEAAFKAALSLKEELARDYPKVDAHRDALANTQLSLGNVYAAAGRHAESVAVTRKALELWQHLVEQRPRDTKYRIRLASGYNNLAATEYEMGQVSATEASFRRALAIEEELVREHPQVPVYRNQVAQGYYNLAVILGSARRQDQSEAAFKKALAVAEELVREHPRLPGYRAQLAEILIALGNLYARAGRMGEAEPVYVRAQDAWDRLVAEQPKAPSYRSNLANCHHSLGLMYRRTHRPEKSETEFRSALAIQEAMARDYPGVPMARCSLANTYRSLGNLKVDTARLDDAEAAYRRALEIQEKLNGEFPGIPEYLGDMADTREDRAKLFARIGRLAEAETSLRAALEIRETLPVASPVDLYNLACAYANFDKTIGRPVSGPGSQADRAMAALRRAVEAGFTDAAHIRADHDLDSLRSRPDFRAMMLDLDFPAEPFVR